MESEAEIVNDLPGNARRVHGVGNGSNGPPSRPSLSISLSPTGQALLIGVLLGAGLAVVAVYYLRR